MCQVNYRPKLGYCPLALNPYTGFMFRLIMVLVLAAVCLGAETKAVFYMTQTPDSMRSFLDHADQVGILIPTAYKVDDRGLVWGALDPKILQAAAAHGVPVMPIVANPGFDQKIIHALLGDEAAQQRMIASLTSECERFRYYGIQFDFEHVSFTDRDALTSLVRRTAQALAAGGFKLSIATVHVYSDFPGASDYAHWLYEDWRGAYDLKELAKFCDFISVMAYDQHTGHTTPGPVAGFKWVQQVLEYSLAEAPKEKISLGIPLYGRRWYAGIQNGQGALQIASVNAAAALALAAANGVEPVWDDAEKAPWYFFYADGERQYVFYNDAHSFQSRYDLAKRYSLHSFSAWVLGAEDPAIWSTLPARGH